MAKSARSKFDLMEERSELRYQLAEAKVDLNEVHKAVALVDLRNADLQRENERLLACLIDYGEHQRPCVYTQFEAGEPTPDGGYRRKFAGEWYDSDPECTCGFRTALAKPEEKPSEEEMRHG